MIITPRVTSLKPANLPPATKALSPQTKAKDSVCFSGNEDSYENGSNYEDAVAEIINAVYPFHQGGPIVQGTLESTTQSSSKQQERLQKLKPVLDKLNGLNLGRAFPLERSLIDPALTVPRNVGAYITSHPKFNEILEKEPKAFQKRLETFSHIADEINQWPDSQELSQTNRYAYQHFSHSVLAFLAQKLMNDPQTFERKIHAVKTGMVRANFNAQRDPFLNTEEKILQFIEENENKIKLLQATLEASKTRDLANYLNPEALEPDPHAHPLVQAAQKQVHHLAQLKSLDKRAAFEKQMQRGEEDFTQKLDGELRKQATLHQLYFKLSKYIRAKAINGFSKPVAKPHPLSASPEFRAMWLECGGDPGLIGEASNLNFGATQP